MRVPALLLLLCLAAHAEIIDRIAVAVGNQAITQTEITRDIRLASLLNGETPDYSAPSRQKAAARLVEQALVRREMSFGSYPKATAAQVDEALAGTVKSRGGQARLDQELSSYGLTLADLRAYLGWQIELLKFLDLRFRPAVQVTDEDIQTYFQANFAPVAGKTPDLTQLHDQIQEKLTGERVDAEVERWIQNSRKRTQIVYLDSALAPPASSEPKN